MKLAIMGVAALALSIGCATAAPEPLPKDCPKAFVKAWGNRGTATTLPKPKRPCLLRGETGIYICDDRGCARP